MSSQLVLNQLTLTEIMPFFVGDTVLIFDIVSHTKYRCALITLFLHNGAWLGAVNQRFERRNSIFLEKSDTRYIPRDNDEHNEIEDCQRLGSRSTAIFFYVLYF